MGPRSDDRGSLNPNTPISGVLALQWGRDQMIAEVELPTDGIKFLPKLQWGRDQMIAEVLAANRIRKILGGLNGAAIR